VTAAHCITDDIYVNFNQFYEDDNAAVRVKAVEAVVHPRYDPATLQFDIALVRVPLPAGGCERANYKMCVPDAGEQLQQEGDQYALFHF